MDHGRIIFSRWYIEHHNVSPTFINCTVAPFAADCPSTNSVSDASLPLHRFLFLLSEQNEHVFRLSLLFLIALFLIFSLSLIRSWQRPLRWLPVSSF